MRTCPIGYGNCQDCQHRREIADCGFPEDSHELTLQEAADQALRGSAYQDAPTPLFIGKSKASELQYILLKAALGEWYDRGYRLEMGEDIITLYYAGYDDVVLVLGKEVSRLPAIHQACYLHALKQKQGGD